MLCQVTLAQPDPREVKENALAILGRLRMRDDQVLEDLLGGQQMGGLNIPAIRKAGEVEEVRRLLSLQEESDAKDREYIKAKISEKAVDLLNLNRKAFQTEISKIAIERGIDLHKRFWMNFVRLFPMVSATAETTCSFTGMKARLIQQGVGELRFDAGRAILSERA